MLSKPELFNAVQTFTPNQRKVYEIGLFGSIMGAGALSAGVISGLSVLLAQVLTNSDLSTDAVIGVVMLPALMSFLFAVANFDRAEKPYLNKTRAMTKAGWWGVRSGFISGLVVLTIIHFLGQLILARAVYGPFTTTSKFSDFCVATPVLYGVLFAIPVAIGTALFTMYFEVSAQVIYELIASNRLPGQSWLLRR